jgi:uncharacterized membrane protein HdeD (DUF308 family)
MANEDYLSSGIAEVREHRLWFLILGIAFVVLGFIAMGSAVAVTLVSVVFFGWLLVFAGLFQVVHGFARRRWSGFFLNLLAGVLYAVTGLLMVSNPAVAAATLTLMIAMLLIVAGTFRLFVAFSTPLQHRGWLIFNGAIAILLGVSIWDGWPFTGLWVIGTFIGIDLMFDGLSEMMLALSVPRA